MILCDRIHARMFRTKSTVLRSLLLTCSLLVFVVVAELLAQSFLVLYCHFSLASSNVTYYGYITEVVPILFQRP
jgi:hypothetical protein